MTPLADIDLVAVCTQAITREIEINATCHNCDGVTVAIAGPVEISQLADAIKAPVLCSSCGQRGQYGMVFPLLSDIRKLEIGK